MTLRNFAETFRKARLSPDQSDVSIGQIIDADGNDLYVIRTHRRTLYRVHDSRRQEGEPQLRIGDYVRVRRAYKHIWEIADLLVSRRDQDEDLHNDSGGISISDRGVSLSSGSQQVVVNREQAIIQAGRSDVQLNENEVDIHGEEVALHVSPYVTRFDEDGINIRPNLNRGELESIAVWPKDQSTTLEVFGNIYGNHTHTYDLKITVPIKVSPSIKLDSSSLVNPGGSYTPRSFTVVGFGPSLDPRIDGISVSWTPSPEAEFYEVQYLLGYTEVKRPQPSGRLRLSTVAPWIYGAPRLGKLQTSFFIPIELPYIAELLKDEYINLSETERLTLRPSLIAHSGEDVIDIPLNHDVIRLYYVLCRTRIHVIGAQPSTWSVAATTLEIRPR